jgi:hypothetical protein
MRHLVNSPNVGRWHWFMWVLAALLGMGILFSSITASQSHGQDYRSSSPYIHS